MDPWVEVMTDLIGKLDNMRLVNQDFTNRDLLLDLQKFVYKKQIVLKSGLIAQALNIEFERFLYQLPSPKYT